MNLINKLEEITSKELTQLYSQDKTLSSLSKAESDEIKKRLAYNSIHPQVGETYEAWFYRLSLIWGNLELKYNNTQENIKNKKLTPDKFINIIADEENMRIFGVWHKEQKAINILLFYRNFVGYDGKKHREELTVEIKLKSDLSKILANATSKGIFGWFTK